MLKASVCGAVDFKTCNGSRAWWSGTLLKLHALEDDLFLRAAQLHVLQAIGVQGMPDLGHGPAERQKHALEAIKRYRHESMPWFDSDAGQNGASPLDAIAMWYSVFGNDERLVKEMTNG